jgi:hypothetical protein
VCVCVCDCVCLCTYVCACRVCVSLGHFFFQAKLGIVECLKHDMVVPYPILAEKDGEFTAQFKFTVLLMPTGTLRMTRYLMFCFVFVFVFVLFCFVFVFVLFCFVLFVCFVCLFCLFGLIC